MRALHPPGSSISTDRRVEADGPPVDRAGLITLPLTMLNTAVQSAMKMMSWVDPEGDAIRNRSHW